MALSKQQILVNDRPLTAIDDALRRIFSTPTEETVFVRARKVMGRSVEDLSDEELEIYITEFQHLIDHWLDTYEKQIFEGQTLKQVLGQG